MTDQQATLITIDQKTLNQKILDEVQHINDGVVAVGVSFEDYMQHYAANFYEWENGAVIKMSPVSLRHTLLVKYLIKLFDIYFDLKPIGTVVFQPFVMRLEGISGREPDLQIILKTNPGQLTDTAMIGAADICIEVVSPESVERDYGTKFQEYEQGGVAEYWIIDPVRKTCRFYRLADGLYADILPDNDGNYSTPKLPNFQLHVPTLWEESLPDIFAITEAVKAMLQS